MDRSGGGSDRHGARDALRDGAVAAGLLGLALAVPLRRAAAHSRQLTAQLTERLDHLQRRLDGIDQATAARHEELAIRSAALGERQASTEEGLANVPVILNALAQQLADVRDRRANVDALTQRLESLDRRIARLQEEVDTAGTLAATAVAAADEVDTLAPSLRMLQRELVQLAEQVRARLDPSTGPEPEGEDGAVPTNNGAPAGHAANVRTTWT